MLDKAPRHRGIRDVKTYVFVFIHSPLCGGVWSASFSCNSTPGKETSVLLNRWLICPQRLSGRFGAEQNLWSLQGIEPRFLGCKPVAQSFERTK